MIAAAVDFKLYECAEIPVRRECCRESTDISEELLGSGRD